MKVIFLTGDHPRHAAMAQEINKTGLLSAIVVEKRKAHIPTPPEDISPELKELFNLHFQKRSAAEEKFFPQISWPEVPIHQTTLKELNSQNTIDFISAQKPDLLISYGVHKLVDEIIEINNCEAWNIHGGLSPWYRGNITHFWPSYLLEPSQTGMTVHKLTQDIDAGDVVHQTVAPLVKGDGVHDLACRAVISLQEEIGDLIRYYAKHKSVKYLQHTTTGKIWTAKNWRPEHLKLVYQFYNDQIVDYVLSGEIANTPVKIYKQF